LQIHYSTFHNTNNNNNSLKNQTIIKSPFLVKGTLSKSISYDSTYSLDNFIPVVEEDEKIKTIGSGSYGQVYLGYNTIKKDYYAIKHMDKKTIFSLLHTLEAARDEIEIQSRIDHPNIVKLLFVKETDISYDLVMEYAPKGNLFHFIRKTKGLTEDLSFVLFIQIVNAINFLHENDLIHRDIKPENILIFENDIVKLCDFGWCVRLDGQQRETFCGTTEYMSPELVKHKGYGKEIDVWSLGILLYEMIHGYSPFRPNKPDFDEKDVMENIINHNLSFEKNVSTECKNLIYGLLDPNINNRYKVGDIYNSEFVKKYEENHFDFKNNNKIFTNKNFYQSENQINNIVYSPQIEMNNNINIHMSMDMNNYVYNIQIPEKNDNCEDNKKNDFNDKNQILQKINKGVYTNYINSVNNLGNINNYYIYKSVNENINKNFTNNNSKQNKLNNNKTWNPANLQESKEESANIYSSQINDSFPEDSKRGNKNVINFL
jgi:serine/threonine protein kinase